LNAIDILIIAIFLAFGLSGYNKGFILSFFNLIGFIVSLYIAKLYYPIVYKYIVNNTEIYMKIKTYVVERVANMFSTIASGESMEGIIDSFKLPDPMKAGVIKNSYEMTQPIQETMGNDITNLIVTIISFLIVFLVAKIILFIVIRVLDGVSHLPVLNMANKSLGLGFGVLKGGLMVYVLFAILTPVITMFPDGFIANNTINSKLGNFFYTKNIIIMFIKTISS